jgi:protein arginine kinase activator
MKMCDECGTNVANVHLTQIMQDETQVFHLCDECARKKGINITVNEENFEEITEQKNQEPDKICTRCGLKYSEFKAKGWLGCASCYTAFEDEIDDLLVQVHGSSIHKGKKYIGVPANVEVAGKIKRLRHELALAIKNEEFEQAAMLRDEIHSLKQIGVQ